MCLSYPEIFLHQFLAAHFCSFKEASLGLRRLVFVRRLGLGHTIPAHLAPDRRFADSAAASPAQASQASHQVIPFGTEVVPKTGLEQSRSGFPKQFLTALPLYFLENTCGRNSSAGCHFFPWGRCTLRGLSLLVCCSIIPRKVITPLSVKTRQVSLPGTVSRFCVISLTTESQNGCDEL